MAIQHQDNPKLFELVDEKERMLRELDELKKIRDILLAQVHEISSKIKTICHHKNKDGAPAILTGYGGPDSCNICGESW